MESIKLEITKEDIIEYLKRHRGDENIKYQEAMFVKYMKETEIFGEEALRILFTKYNKDTNDYTDIYTYTKQSGLIKTKLKTFDNYLSTIQNLDISGVCHIMIPAIRYYGEKTSIQTIKLRPVLETLKVESRDDEQEILQDTFENYRISNQLKYTGNGYEITMNDGRASRELEKLKLVYGTMPIKKIEKVIKMGRY